MTSRITIFSLILMMAMTSALSGQFIADGFTIETILAEPQNMVGCTFADDGSMFVWTKDGKVFIYRDGSLIEEPVLDISEEVANYGDHGMLGFALDPDFINNGLIYTSYVVDPHYLLYFGTPDYDPEESIENRATIARITRFKLDAANDFLSVLPHSRQVLLGKEVGDNIAILHNSHSIGALVFGDDGTLLAGFGDGSTWEGVYAGGGPPYYNEDVENALADGILDPEEDLGSYKAQLLSFHNGKLLRMDPHTGAGLASNPFYDPEDPFSAQSRIWAIGMRNPYRFTIRKGSGSQDPEAGLPGTVYLGDVSHYNREELNILPFGGANLGWPLFEGEATAPDYYALPTANPLAPNPSFDGDACSQEFYNFQDLVINKDPEKFSHTNPCTEEALVTDQPTFVHTWPALTWRHHWTGDYAYAARYNENGEPEQVPLNDPESKIEGDMFYGTASVGGTFYTGDKFPEEYRDKYFHLDYEGWIRVLDMDLNDEIQAIDLFYQNDRFLVHLTEGPDGCLYAVELPGGVRKICFGGNVSPRAQFKMDQQYGPSPLTVQFENESTDGNNDTLTYFWEFGDNATSTEEHPTHTFTAPGSDPFSYEVKLTVEDGNGGSNTTTQIVSLNNTPPSVDITSFEDGQKYGDMVGFLAELTAEVEDLESGKDDLTYSWQYHLHHNFHSHFEIEYNEPQGEMYLASVGCDQSVPAIFYHRLQLTVTDPQGLSTTDTVFLYPDCAFKTNFIAASYYEDSPDNGLSWTIETSDSVVAFSLQMKNSDGNFVEFDRVSGFDHFQGTRSFNFTSEIVIPNQTYRVKYETAGGTFGYSDEISPTGENKISLLGNPVSSLLLFELPFPSERVDVMVFNNLGQEVYHGELSASSQGDFSIDTRALIPGTYILVVETAQSRYEERFIKMN